MGVSTQPKTNRNFTIYKLYSEGEKVKKLMEIYDLNESRIYQIIKWVQMKKSKKGQ
jgi:Mor family transcriptional regulator